jgi:hypothetical protein
MRPPVIALLAGALLIAACESPEVTAPRAQDTASRWQLTAAAQVSGVDAADLAYRVSPYEIARRAAPWTTGPVLARAVAGPPTCTNGSTMDCNPSGTTLIPSSAFVDPSPPPGFQQCAGFTNTPDDDVRWDWENNCDPFKDGVLFLRAFDTGSGAIIAGARLYRPVVLGFISTGRNYATDSYEGAGFVDNPNDRPAIPGTSLGFHPFDGTFCRCPRGAAGLRGMCNDVFTASAANDATFFVGGNSTNHDYEASWGPPGPKNSCVLNNEIVRLSVAIYTEVVAPPPPGPPAPTEVTAALLTVAGKPPKARRGLFTVDFACSVSHPTLVSAEINGFAVTDDQVVDLRLTKKSRKAKRKRRKNGKPMLIRAHSFELVVKCADAAGSLETETAAPDFADKSKKSGKKSKKSKKG